MNAHLQAALVDIWTAYAADIERRNGDPQFAIAARATAQGYRDGRCICGKPVADHFDRHNRRISCEKVKP